MNKDYPAAKIVSLILFFLLTCSPLNAQQMWLSFNYQGIDFSPYFRPGLRYIDNVYSTAKKKGDFLFTFSPGITAKFSLSRQVFEINYGWDFALFTRYSSLNYSNTSISGLADLNLDNYSLNLKKGYSKSYFPPTYYEEYIRLITETNKILLESKFRLFSFDFGWQGVSYRYSPTRRERYEYWWNRDDYLYTLTGYLKIYPKTSLLSEYTYGEIKYPHRPERKAKYHLFLTGVRGKITAKLSGLVKFGYQKRNYQTLNDWRGLSVWANLNEKFSSTTEANFSYERTVNESEFTDKNYYTVNRISAGLSQKIPYLGLEGGGGLAFASENYPIPVEGVERKDKVFEYTLNLGYKFWKLPFGGITYQYTQRDSNFNGYDYDTQTIAISVRRLF